MYKSAIVDGISLPKYTLIYNNIFDDIQIYVLLDPTNRNRTDRDAPIK